MVNFNHQCIYPLEDRSVTRKRCAVVETQGWPNDRRLHARLLNEIGVHDRYNRNGKVTEQHNVEVTRLTEWSGEQYEAWFADDDVDQ